MSPLIFAGIAASLAGTPGVLLLTIEPGDEFVTKAGHATLCVTDADRPLNSAPCYNYGATDMSDELRLTLDYFREEAQFYVTTPIYAEFLYGHGQRQDRTIWQQWINLEPEAAKALADEMARDALPENRAYRYHHFRANCTSRLRDLLDKASKGRLSDRADAPYTATWREVARVRFAGLPWLQVGAEMAGRPADRVPSVWEAMVLPEVLREQVELRLGSPPRIVYFRQGATLGVGSPWGGAAAWVGWGAAWGAVAAVSARWTRARRGVGIALSAVLGLGGSACVGLVVVSTLEEVRHNELIAVFLPTDLLVPLIREPWRERYLAFRVVSVAAIASFQAMGLFVQPPWVTISALLALLGLWTLSKSVERRP